MTRKFDRVASFYDRLVNLVFGNSLHEAQSLHLSEIESGESVLVIGGGTGSILSEIPEGAMVTYLDASEQMTTAAKKYPADEYLTIDFLEWDVERKFDWIIAPFFFLLPFNQL